MLLFSDNFDDESDGIDGLVVYKQTKWRSLHLRVIMVILINKNKMFISEKVFCYYNVIL